ncbi:glycine betaine ABC transporter substrate-binding protein, partial [Rubrivivax gelatinosus]|nr:glycine betaine ABC transporter substrate-binding protein [Rubrivivax gelatinosus]
MTPKALRGLAAAAGLTAALAAGSALAQDKPGEGVEVIPLKSSIAEETFQTVLV